MDNRTHGGDEDCFVATGDGIQSAGFHPLGDGFGLVGIDILGARIAVLGARPREVPMKVRMSQPGGEPTLLAFAARGTLSVLAQNELAEPERESLFADPSRAMKEQAGRQRPAREGIAQLRLKRGVPV